MSYARGASWFDTVSQMSLPTPASASDRENRERPRDHAVSKAAQKHRERNAPQHRRESEKTRQSAKERHLRYADASYPDTVRTSVDWALFAAQRVVKARRAASRTPHLPNTITADERQRRQHAHDLTENVRLLFFAPYGGGRTFSDDTRHALVAQMSLEGLLLCEFLPERMYKYLQTLADSHRQFKRGVDQCCAQLDYYVKQMNRNSARNRDLLIKKMLFSADNQQTACTVEFDYVGYTAALGHVASANDVWSPTMTSCLREPDLFGRAVAVLVSDVLQSCALRVRSLNNSCPLQTVRLELSWDDAYRNMTGDVTHIADTRDQVNAPSERTVGSKSPPTSRTDNSPNIVSAADSLSTVASPLSESTAKLSLAADTTIVAPSVPAAARVVGASEQRIAQLQKSARQRAAQQDVANNRTDANQTCTKIVPTATPGLFDRPVTPPLAGTPPQRRAGDSVAPLAPQKRETLFPLTLANTTRTESPGPNALSLQKLFANSDRASCLGAGATGATSDDDDNDDKSESLEDTTGYF